MNIETKNIQNNINENPKTVQSKSIVDSSTKFADELKINDNIDTKDDANINDNTNKNICIENSKNIEVDFINNIYKNEKQVSSAIENLNLVVKEFNQSDEKELNGLKNDDKFVDGEIMINNDYNIHENKELLPQMNMSMGFSSNGEPFASYMNEQKQNDSNKLESTAQDLLEEAAILSTMSENLAIANRNQVLSKDLDSIKNKKEILPTVNLKEDVVYNDEQVVIRNNEIKKINTKTGITQEIIVKFDNVIMNEADVEVFSQIVQQGEVNIKNLTPQAVEKSINVSKTLADMLVKSMENNQPLRIDFDNNISVIIRINREGKISADFLPSSQIAEAYLKENLPLLRQKFDDNNVKYEELNQRERREQKDNNRKKGRNDE